MGSDANYTTLSLYLFHGCKNLVISIRPHVYLFCHNPLICFFTKQFVEKEFVEKVLVCYMFMRHPWQEFFFCISQACHKKLEECESKEDANSSSLQALATSLVQPFLISHRTKEVKSLVACCIADIFRVYYPKPPYDEGERKVGFY